LEKTEKSTTEETNTDNSYLAQNTMLYCSIVARICGQHKLTECRLFKTCKLANKLSFSWSLLI